MGEKLTEKIFNIKKSQKEIVIKFGDIFFENGLKVITFNEYFDTEVDEEIISSKTLNGILITKFIKDNAEFNKRLEQNLKAIGEFVAYNSHRNIGKRTKYKLGTCVKYDDYLLVAFSKFNDKNEAYLTFKDYSQCMTTMWDNILDLYCLDQEIVFPVMGSGLTRLDFFESSKEDLNNYYSLLINKMLKPLKNKKIPVNTKITIVIHNSLKDKIDLEKLNIDRL